MNLKSLAASSFSQRTRISDLSVVDREESIRVYWMIEKLDSMTYLGSRTNNPNLTLQLPSKACFPCPESTWLLREPIIETTASPTSITDGPCDGQPDKSYPSVYSLCIILVLQELGAVHRFLSESHDQSSLETRLEWQTAAQKLDERLTQWREEFVADVFRLINGKKDHLPHGEMEPLITLANCVLNT